MKNKLPNPGNIAIFLFLCFSFSLYSQTPIPTPELSQAASVMQRIGLTDITINYHRPAVNGRAIWGKLVPYNTVWRAGANENTTITFTDPVLIAGKEVPAGSYGLHTIPTENEWTIILSKYSKAWGSFFYKEEEDQLRFNVKPVSAPMTEYLNYSFETSAPNKTLVALQWEKLNIPFEIEVNVPQVVVNRIRENLRGLNGFFWQPFQQAAAYCVINNTNLDEAETWIDRSIQINKSFSNLSTKAQLVELKGNMKESEELLKQAYTMGTEVEINNYGYVLLQSKKIDKAIEIFRLNVEKFPASWNAYDSLAEGYLNKGDKKLAIENYKKALDMVKDDTQKKRISNTLNTLASN